MQTIKQRRALAHWLNREWEYQSARSHSDGGIAFRARLFPGGLPSEQRRIDGYAQPVRPEPNAELITLGTERKRVRECSAAQERSNMPHLVQRELRHVCAWITAQQQPLTKDCPEISEWAR